MQQVNSFTNIRVHKKMQVFVYMCKSHTVSFYTNGAISLNDVTLKPSGLIYNEGHICGIIRHWKDATFFIN